MSQTDGQEDGRQGDSVDAQLALVRELATDSEALLTRLRHTQIPQQVGMAAAGRALAADVPRALVARLQTELASGALGKRWEGALKRAGAADGERKPEAELAAVATLLIELAQRAGSYVSGRADEWAGDAYRLEGQAAAIEDQVQRLGRAREGIARSQLEGAAAEERQTRRRTERANGTAPGRGGEGDGHDA